jgi:hypothetical protein
VVHHLFVMNLINCTFRFFYLIIGITLITDANAQSKRVPFFIGINPSITVEPFYEKGELDISILPIVFQRSVSKRTDIRFTSVVNLGIRKTGNQISHLGLETVFPFFLRAKESRQDYSSGFFIAPVLSITSNQIEKHQNIGLWLEPGYQLLFDNAVAMSFGLQFGGTYFHYNNGTSKWGSHFGAKIILGKWMTNKKAK